MGESLNEFVKRVRLERALAMLSRKTWPTRRKPSLTEFAFACGFDSSSDFSRCFKQRYGVAPSQFDVESFRVSRREDWLSAAGPEHRHHLDKLKPGTNPDGFEVREARRIENVGACLGEGVQSADGVFEIRPVVEEVFGSCGEKKLVSLG